MGDIIINLLVHLLFAALIVAAFAVLWADIVRMQTLKHLDAADADLQKQRRLNLKW